MSKKKKKQGKVTPITPLPQAPAVDVEEIQARVEGFMDELEGLKGVVSCQMAFSFNGADGKGGTLIAMRNDMDVSKLIIALVGNRQ